MSAALAGPAALPVAAPWPLHAAATHPHSPFASLV